jgi:hypothetical protein
MPQRQFAQTWASTGSDGLWHPACVMVFWLGTRPAVLSQLAGNVLISLQLPFPWMNRWFIR